MYRKNLLYEIVESGDLTSEKFNTIQRRVESNVNDINPADEYKEFTEKYKYERFLVFFFSFEKFILMFV